MEQGEEQQDDVTVKAYAAEDDAGHFFCVHAGSAADSGGYGVVAAHGHDGVADIAEADEDEDGRGKEALDEGHGEHADIITGDVDHDEAAAVHEGDSRLVDNYVALGVRLDYLIHLQKLPERRNEPQEAVKYGKRESQEQKALRLCVDYFYKIVFLGHFSDELTVCTGVCGHQEYIEFLAVALPELLYGALKHGCSSLVSAEAGGGYSDVYWFHLCALPLLFDFV